MTKADLITVMAKHANSSKASAEKGTAQFASLNLPFHQLP